MRGTHLQIGKVRAPCDLDYYYIPYFFIIVFISCLLINNYCDIDPVVLRITTITDVSCFAVLEASLHTVTLKLWRRRISYDYYVETIDQKDSLVSGR